MTQRIGRRQFTRSGLVSTAALLASSSWARALEAVKSDFHLGLVTYNVAKDWDLDTLLRLCREAGFEGVELRTSHRHGVERTLAPAERAEVRRKIKQSGVQQVSLGSVCEFHSADPAVVAKNVQDCREWTVLAKEIGARAVKVRPNGLRKDVPEDASLQQIGRALAECGAAAKENGVEIWVEVHGETRIPARMRRIMEVCAHPSVGLTWNSNDSDVVNGSVAESFALLRPFVRCCHITDLSSAYPYRELFTLLRGSGFGGFTLCEYPQAVPPAEGLAWLRAYRERWEALKRPA